MTRLVQRVELSGRTHGGRPFLDVDELVLLKPQQDGVDRALHDVHEAECAQGRCDFIAVGFTAADDLEHTALEHALQHLRDVLQGDGSLLDRLTWYVVLRTTATVYHRVEGRSTSPVPR